VFANSSSRILQGAALERALWRYAQTGEVEELGKRGERDISVKYESLSSV